VHHHARAHNAIPRRVRNKVGQEQRSGQQQRDVGEVPHTDGRDEQPGGDRVRGVERPCCRVTAPQARRSTDVERDGLRDSSVSNTVGAVAVTTNEMQATGRRDASSRRWQHGLSRPRALRGRMTRPPTQETRTDLHDTAAFVAKNGAHMRHQARVRALRRQAAHRRVSSLVPAVARGGSE
jgi:hypothetical protein